MSVDIQKLGIIAGGGHLPDLLVEHCQRENIPFHVVIFKGQPQPHSFDMYEAESTQLALGQVGKVIQTFKEQGVTHLVMGGRLEKPSLFDLRLDLKGLKIINRLRTKHDDELLTSVCDFLEEEGFDVIGAHEVREDLLMPSGLLTKTQPSASQRQFIAIGMEAVEALGALDIGQAAVIKEGVILGVEGVEGTAELIQRCASLRGKENKGAILVKAAKPKQNLRVDMPTIGLETIEQLAQLNYEGVAILAGQSLFLDREKALRVADQKGLFICGVGTDGCF
tara:strand:- start:184885 stop:185724 length:840 start_codon:yes stop_codon:yes gene_type:complete